MPAHEPCSTAPNRTAAPTKAIIFDIGRVIVRINLSRLLEPLAALVPAGAGASPSERLSPQQIWAAIEADPAGEIGKRAA